jgi:hypothetical protein
MLLMPIHSAGWAASKLLRSTANLSLRQVVQAGHASGVGECLPAAADPLLACASSQALNPLIALENCHVRRELHIYLLSIVHIYLLSIVIYLFITSAQL